MMLRFGGDSAAIRAAVGRLGREGDGEEVGIANCSLNRCVIDALFRFSRHIRAESGLWSTTSFKARTASPSSFRMRGDPREKRCERADSI